MELNKIHQGDCIEELKKLPENSVDAIITDPPYGLEFMGKDWDKLNKHKRPKANNKYPKNRNYASGRYDESNNVEQQKFHNKWATECLRVLKAGGFLLSFGGTRTYHRLVCGIEDAGFEIRDTIMWLYGSGFPKSLNIGKQIDNMQGNKREVVGQESIGTYKSLSRIRVEQGYRNNLTKSSNKIDITKGNSEWEGWGTALKPACEPIVVARKPLSEQTVALNVLKHGTGGINIDACRIKYLNDKDKKEGQSARTSERNGNNQVQVSGDRSERSHITGRFPANVILDEEAGKILDEQSGNTGAFAPVKRAKRPNNVYGEYEYFGDNGKTFRGDKGGASRFFYCAKASKSERNYGCEELDDKHFQMRPFAEKGCDKSVLKNRMNSKSGKNNHPTVKPLKLMEYLVKLVSREGATVLDPFTGSGTTLIACIKLGRKGIGIEKEPEYIKIAEARIKPYLKQKKLFETIKE